MRSYFYDLRFKVDRTEWRARAKRDLVFQFWKKYRPNPNKKKKMMLDLGCGTGVLQEQFAKRFDVDTYGIDVSKEAIKYCRKRFLTNVKIFDGKKIPFKSGTFDLVTAVDVLEHIHDDIKALDEIKRVLKKGGLAIILVPADAKLWSTRDVRLHHFRRYAKKELGSKCEKAGFRIITSKNVDFALYFIFAAIHSVAPKIKGVAQLGMETAATNKILNEIMYFYELMENRLQNFLSFPVGLSVVLVVQKVSA